MSERMQSLSVKDQALAAVRDTARHAAMSLSRSDHTAQMEKLCHQYGRAGTAGWTKAQIDAAITEGWTTGEREIAAHVEQRNRLRRKQPSSQTC